MSVKYVSKQVYMHVSCVKKQDTKQFGIIVVGAKYIYMYKLSQRKGQVPYDKQRELSKQKYVKDLTVITNSWPFHLI